MREEEVKGVKKRNNGIMREEGLGKTRKMRRKIKTDNRKLRRERMRCKDKKVDPHVIKKRLFKG